MTNEGISNLINYFNIKFSTIIQINSTKSFFTTNFPIPLELNESFNYKVALQWFSVYNTIFNVTNKNNQFMFDNKIYKIKPGSYEIKDILSEMNALIKPDKIDFSIKINYGKLQINSSTKTLSFNTDYSLAEILGFEKTQDLTSVAMANVPQATVNLPQATGNLQKAPILGSNKIDVSNINSINILCDLVQNSYIANETGGSENSLAIQKNLLYTFPYGTVLMGFRIVQSPNPIIYLPMTRKNISSISFQITDQDGNLLDFNNEKISLALHIEQV